MGRRWILALHIIALGVVALFVRASLVRNWDAFRSLHIELHLHAGWLATSVLAILVTYAIQVASWRVVLAGWGEVLAYRPAMRVWFLSNLGRYVPGKVWSVAGMVVLAQRAGVGAWAAATSAVVIQALGLGTAAALVASTTSFAGAGWRFGLAGVAAIATLGLLSWQPGLTALGRRLTPTVEWRALPLRFSFAAALLTLSSWMTYGVAFWLLARGMGLAGHLPIPRASGVFAGGYIAGLLALPVPGGIGVREAVYVSLLTPVYGSGGALALAGVSRLQLTLTEAGAAVAALLFTPTRQGGRP